MVASTYIHISLSLYSRMYGRRQLDDRRFYVINSNIPLETRVEIIEQLSQFKNKELARRINVDCSVISCVRHKKFAIS